MTCRIPVHRRRMRDQSTRSPANANFLRREHISPVFGVGMEGSKGRRVFAQGRRECGQIDTVI